MKKALTALFLAATMVLTAGLAGCGGRAPGGDGGGGTTPGGNDTALKNFTMQANEYQSYSSYSVDKKDESGNVIGTGLTDYNKDLYYINEVKFAIADPSVIYVDHGEEEGYFYAYGTSDLIGGRGFQCWRSKDLTNWEYKGVCYRPDYNTCWDFTNHWAPEVIYDADLDKYLIFFNADWNERVGWGGGKESKHISVAYAEEPYGPFVQDNDEKPAYDFSTTNKLIKPELMRDNAIDVHPFVDPKTKQKYLYYSGYGTDGNGQNHPQTILGCRMKSWSEPDYSSIVELTRYNSSVVDRDLADMGEGDGVNEGPFVWYKDGTYFLTFSTYGFE